MSHPVSLSERRVIPLTEVMSEQLASKLNTENNPQTDEDPELLLALYLSTLDNQTPTSTQTPTPTNSSSPSSSSHLEDDYLIACLLQAELDSQTLNPVQKPKTKLREYNEEEEEEYEYMKLRGTGRGPPIRTMKTSKGEIITKHDPKRAGALNSARLEATLTRLPTGDLSGTFPSSGGIVEEGTSEKLGLCLPTRVYNSLHQKTKKMTRLGIRYKNIREDRQVQEEVLDVRTRRVLQKLLNTRSLSRVEGTLSTGKESRVFLAYSDFGPEQIADPEQAEPTESEEEIAYAVKVFKEAIGGYSDRERYLPTKAFGHRRGGKRREILVWAEKEFRNLKELHRAGLRVPQPALLRQVVVLMKFLGDPSQGLPAPRLKDAAETLSIEQLTDCYWELVRMMRRMYQNAKLVHADLSEYNVLWHLEKPWLIDVSQSIPTFHENALTFLRRDCLNVATFFNKQGVDGALSPRQLFEFITDDSLGPNEYEEEDTSVTHNFLLKRISEENLRDPQDWANDQVFLKSFIPRSLSEVPDPLVEIESLRNLEDTDLFHSSVTGLNKDFTLRTKNESTHEELVYQDEQCDIEDEVDDEVDDEDEDEK